MESDPKQKCGVFLSDDLLRYPWIICHLVKLLFHLLHRFELHFFAVKGHHEFVTKSVFDLLKKEKDAGSSLSEHLYDMYWRTDAEDIHSPEDLFQKVMETQLDLIVGQPFLIHVMAIGLCIPFLALIADRDSFSLLNGRDRYTFPLCFALEKWDEGIPFLSELESDASIPLESWIGLIDKELFHWDQIRCLLQVFVSTVRVMLDHHQMIQITKQIAYQFSKSLIDEIKDFRDNRVVDAEMASIVSKIVCASITGCCDAAYGYGFTEQYQREPHKIEDMIKWIKEDFESQQQKEKNKERECAQEESVSMVEKEEEKSQKLNIFINKKDYINYKGVHRSGWYQVIYLLHLYSQEGGVICDMYLDRTFHWARHFYIYKGMIPYTSPWIGFIHHSEETTYSEYNTTVLFENKEFCHSLFMCRGLITMSHRLGNWVRAKAIEKGFHFPVLILMHPTDTHVRLFSMRAFEEHRLLVNVGAWMRRPFSIFTVQTSPCYAFRKAALRGKNMENYFRPSHFHLMPMQPSSSCNQTDTDTKQLDPWITSSTQPNTPCRDISNKWVEGLVIFLLKERLIQKYRYDASSHILYISFPVATDANLQFQQLNTYLSQLIDSVHILPEHDNAAYDDLLSHSVVFLDMVDAAAVNTIIECISRNTPLLINKIPGVVELLGEKYPLYYTDAHMAGSLLTFESVRTAHQYLSHMDKSLYKIDTFLRHFTESELLQNC